MSVDGAKAPPGTVPRLVLLPGLDGTGDLFAPFLGHLPGGLRVTVVRYPRKTFLGFRDLAHLAAGEINPGEPAALLAESFSGPVALEVSRLSGLDLRGFIFCATFATPPFPLLLALSRHLPMTAIVGFPRPRWYGRLVSVGFDAPEELVARVRQVNAQVDPGVLAARVRSLSGIDYRPHLRDLAVPCLYLQPSVDRTVPRRCLGAFRESVRDLTVVRVEGPHMLLQTRPGACADAVLGFLTRL